MVQLGLDENEQDEGFEKTGDIAEEDDLLESDGEGIEDQAEVYFDYGSFVDNDYEASEEAIAHMIESGYFHNVAESLDGGYLYPSFLLEAFLEHYDHRGDFQMTPFYVYHRTRLYYYDTRGPYCRDDVVALLGISVLRH